MTNPNIEIIKNNIKNARNEIASNLNSYLDYLKIVAFNYRYDSNLQSNIFAQFRNATVCASYETWHKKYNRILTKGSKGIGYVVNDLKNNKQYINYVFDISQTVAINGSVPVNIWEYDNKIHSGMFEKLIENSGGEEGIEKLPILDKLAFNYSNAEGINFIEKYQLENEEKSRYYNFLVESIKIVANFRLNLGYEYNLDNLEYHKNLKENPYLLANILHSISTVSKQLVGDIIKEGHEIDINIEKELYNEKNNDSQSEIYRGQGNTISNQSKRGSRESWNELSNNGNRQGEDAGIDSNTGVQKPATGDGRSYFEQVGANEEELSYREPTGVLQRTLAAQLNNQLSLELTDNNRELDNSLSSSKSAEQRSIRRDDFVPVHQPADNENGLGVDKRENELDNPNILITENILNKVPNIYGQEKVASADKVVYAAFFIPFRSHWTWYMTEYNPANKEAFGLVLGDEVEWGYFSITELEELKAQRFILHDFPKTFRELKDIKLKNQITEEELNTAFNGELTFNENDFNIPNKEINLESDNNAALEDVGEVYNSFISSEHDNEPPSEEEFGMIHANNYKLKDEIDYLPSERLNNNIAAIKLIKILDKENRLATDEEKEILSRYVGWGGLAEVFDERKSGQWSLARNGLKELLDEEEYSSARESTLSAFYTPQSIIENIYSTLDRIGFKGGNILEPSCGTGKFIGYSDNSRYKFTGTQRYKFTGIELDSITGKIAKYLYPESNIYVSGYEKVELVNNSFDAAVSNIPFGDFKVFDKEYNKNNFLIHDYYFEKTIDKVKPGGVIAFITSSGTMDKENISVRKYISERCELLGAVRLDNKTFAGNSNTAVTTDVIFLQKRNGIEKVADDWVYLKSDENGLRYNSYYVDNPEMVTGNIEVKTNKFGRNIIACIRTDDYKEKLANAFAKINSLKDFGMIHAEKIIEPVIIDSSNNYEQYSYILIDNKIFYNDTNSLIEQKFNEKDSNRIKDYIQIKNVLKNIISVQLESVDNEKLFKLQNELRQLHSSYAAKYGLLNVGKNERILAYDNDYYLVSSIEIIDKDNKLIDLSDIAYTRTIHKKIDIKHTDNINEALIHSLSVKGKVDIDYIQSLTDKDKKEIIDLLDGQIFLNINKTSIESINKELDFYLEKDGAFEYVAYDEYLTGDIREKITNINSWVNHYEIIGDEVIVDKLSKQKEKLIAVLPKDLEAGEISVELGATWIDDRYINKFTHELLGSYPRDKQNIEVSYVEELDKWNISNKRSHSYNMKVTNTYGTKRMNGYELIEKILNLSTIEIYDTFEEDGKKERVLNKEETLVANQKADMIRMEFKRWIFDDYDRRKYLVDKYNRLFNGYVKRNYNGSYLTFAGINESIRLREYQKNAVARTLYGKNTLLAHTVGAGKTYTMIASGMEAKRMGLSNKAMYVVPKAVHKQFAQSFMKLYPTANLLVVKEKDLTKENRKYFVGKMATGNYDGIILTHEQFGKIEISLELQNEYIQKKLDELEFMEDSLKGSVSRHRRNFSVKEIEQRRKSLQAKLEKNMERMGKDNTIPFESLGIDRLYVDEAHMFKNLGVETKSSKIAGINRTSSLRAVDMKMKCDYINSLDNGRIIFATGTAISNSMTELYTMQSYLQSDMLSKKKILSFDSWASTFGVITRKLELKPEGNGFQIKGRFAKFHNIPELLNIFDEVADIQTADMLNLPTPDASYELIVTKASETQKMILDSISKRADNIRDNLVDPTEDNMLKLTSDGKKLALDQRLINPLLPDEENSKINNCVDKAFEIAEETKEDKLTQIIFCDMSTPNKDKFNVYDDIKLKLINKGMNEDEIVFIHDYDTEIKRAKLFEQVQKGDVRIVLGSTQKLGTGVNIQDKLIAIHDLDVPWRPSDLEQRSGRIIRQGNQNEKVFIYRYVTEGTFDSYLWQTLENKQKFISQIITSKTPARIINETDELSLDYSEIKALATGNPLIKEKMMLENEIANLYMLETNHRNSQQDLETKIKDEYPNKILAMNRRLENMKKDITDIQPMEDEFRINLNSKTFEDKKEAGTYLLKFLTKLVVGERKRDIGEYRGFKLKVEYEPYNNSFNYFLTKNGTYHGNLGNDALGNFTRINNTIDSIADKIEPLEQDLQLLKDSLEKAKDSLGKPFDKADELKDKILRLAEVDQILNLNENNTENKFEDDYTSEYEIDM